MIWLDPANRPIGNRPLLFYSIALLLVGLQLVSLGILAELVTPTTFAPRILTALRSGFQPDEPHVPLGDDWPTPRAASLTSEFSSKLLDFV